MKRTRIGRTLRHLLEWGGVVVLALRVVCRRLCQLVAGRSRVPA